MGDLVLVYKRVTALAGHTSRVAELLESVNRLSAPDAAAYHEQVHLQNFYSLPHMHSLPDLLCSLSPSVRSVLQET